MQLVASAEGLLAVAESGAVFAFDGDDWTQRCAASAVFKQREEAMLACEPGGRVLAWGGKLRGRKSNNTLLLEASDWRQLKGKSDKPKDFAAASGRGGTTIDFTCTFDTTLGCLVRFGYEEAALLDGETWRGKTPKGYKRAIGPRFFQHVAAHDAESGETLLIDLEGGRISRFDLQGCVELARFDYPAALQPAKQHDTPAWARLRDSFCVDKAGRALKAQVLDDAWGSYRLDLAPAFEAARAVGPRGVARGRKAKEHE